MVVVSSMSLLTASAAQVGVALPTAVAALPTAVAGTRSSVSCLRADQVEAVAAPKEVVLQVAALASGSS